MKISSPVGDWQCGHVKLRSINAPVSSAPVTSCHEVAVVRTVTSLCLLAAMGRGRTYQAPNQDRSRPVDADTNRSRACSNSSRAGVAWVGRVGLSGAGELQLIGRDEVVQELLEGLDGEVVRGEVTLRGSRLKTLVDVLGDPERGGDPLLGVRLRSCHGPSG